MTGIKISVDRLQVGNYVSLPLGWREHPFLFSSFKLKNEEEIELIRRLGLKLVTIIPDKSDAPPKPLNQIQPQPVEAPDTSQRQAEMQLEKERRIEQLQQYRRDLQQCEKQFQQSLAQVRSVMSKIQSRPLNAIGEAQELVNAMTEQLLSLDEMVLHLVSDSETRTATTSTSTPSTSACSACCWPRSATCRPTRSARSAWGLCSTTSAN